MTHQEFATKHGYEKAYYPDGREAYLKETVTGIIVMEFETDGWLYLYKSFGLVFAKTYPIDINNEQEFEMAEKQIGKIISFPFS